MADPGWAGRDSRLPALLRSASHHGAWGTRSQKCKIPGAHRRQRAMLCDGARKIQPTLSLPLMLVWSERVTHGLAEISKAGRWTVPTWVGETAKPQGTEEIPVLQRQHQELGTVIESAVRSCHFPPRGKPHSETWKEVASLHGVELKLACGCRNPSVPAPVWLELRRPSL